MAAQNVIIIIINLLSDHTDTPLSLSWRAWTSKDVMIYHNCMKGIKYILSVPHCTTPPFPHLVSVTFHTPFVKIA